jgi:hypothetical protein
MPLDSTWAIHAVKFTHASAPVILSQISRRTTSRNVRQVLNYSAGAIVPGYIAIMTAEPMVSFETTEIGRVLGAIPVDGAGIGVDLSDLWTGVEVYYIKKQNKGGRATGSVHMKQVAAFGMAVWRRVRCRWGEEATIEVEIFAGSVDGETQPLATTTGVALQTMVVDQKWTLGYASLNGTELDNTELEIDSGITINQKGSGADIFNTNLNVNRRSPVARVKTLDPSMYSTHDLDGTAIGASHCDFYLRKIQPAGLRVADATTGHIRFRFLQDQGMIIPGDDSGSDAEDIEADFQVVGITDGTDDAITITNGVAHP